MSKTALTLALILASPLAACGGAEIVLQPWSPDDAIELSPTSEPNSSRQIFGAASPAIVYVNFDGATITFTPAKSDAAANTSPIVGGTIPPYAGPQKEKDRILSELKAIYERYAVEFVTTRPASGPYHMIMIGGVATSLSGPTFFPPAGMVGVSPLDCGSKAPDVVFAFSGAISDALKAQLGANAADPGNGAYYAYYEIHTMMTAYSAAHELAHGFGLPHTVGDGCDLMQAAYVPQVTVYPTSVNMGCRLAFSNKSMSTASPNCSLSSMNPHQTLADLLGTSGSVQPEPEQPADASTSGCAFSTRPSALGLPAWILLLVCGLLRSARPRR